MKKIFILPVLLVLLCTFFVAAARGSIANSRVASSILVDFIATPDSVTVDTLAVDSTKLVANADSLAVDSLAMDSTVLVAKSDSMAIDSLAVDFVAMDTLAVDSVAIDTVALANMVPDSLAIGSLAIDSLAMDSVAMDTLAVDSVAVDSIAVDSAALANMVPDSLLIGYMPKVKEWKYFKFQKLSQSELNALETLFKREYDKVLKVSTPGKLYDTWKLLFNGTADKTLDLYVQGVGIILSKINIDTITHKRYDRVLEYRDELMELYDMAVCDVEKLNTQIDRERSKDTLSVAKLRARQVYTYLDITAKYLQSTSDTAASDTYWRGYILSEKTTGEYATFMYPRYREMLTCNDPNIDMIHLHYFIGLARSKITLDRQVGLPLKRRADNFQADKELVLARADEIYNAPDLDFDATYNKDPKKTILEAYNSYKEQISKVVREAEGNFLAHDDYEGLEKHYAERFQKEEGNNPEFRRELLNSSLQRHYSSDIYIECLRKEYEATPSYELAKRIGDRFLRKYLADKKDNKGNKQDLNDSFSYFKYAIGFFSEETDDFQVAEKVSTYIRAIQVLSQSSGIKDNKTKIKYIKEVENLYPEYPDAYFYEAELIREVAVGIDNKNGKYSAAPYFIVACDLYNKCLNKIKEYNDIQEPLVKSNLTDKVADINKLLQSSRSHIPSTREYHMEGYNHYVGTSGNIKYNGYSYKFTWIAVD